VGEKLQLLGRLTGEVRVLSRRRIANHVQAEAEASGAGGERMTRRLRARVPKGSQGYPEAIRTAVQAAWEQRQLENPLEGVHRRVGGMPWPRST